jgi:hypothetical protein
MWTLTELELLKKIKELAEAENLTEILKLANIRIIEIEAEMQKEAEFYEQSRKLEEVNPYKIKDKFDIRRNKNGRQIIQNLQ